VDQGSEPTWWPSHEPRDSDAQEQHTPDLIDDNKVLAISLVEHPIGLIDSESEGSEKCLTQRRGRLGDLQALFFWQPLQMRQELAIAKKHTESKGPSPMERDQTYSA
jgi:hypothetical protein